MSFRRPIGQARRETLDRKTPARHKARHENNDLHLLLNKFCWFVTGQIVFVSRKVQKTNVPVRTIFCL